MRAHPWFLAVVATLISSACTAGDASSGPGPTGPDGPDAGAPAATDCLVPASFGDLGAIANGTAVVVPQDTAQPAGNKILLFNVQFTDSSAPTHPPDVLHLELWQNVGAFANGYKPGTYAIAGDETDFFKCSTCVVVAGDLVAATGRPTKTYMARGGTVTLTAIDPAVGGKLTGSIAGVSFGDVDVSGAAQVPLTDGCTTAVTKLTFDLTVAAPQ